MFSMLSIIKVIKEWPDDLNKRGFDVDINIFFKPRSIKTSRGDFKVSVINFKLLF